MTAIDLAAMRQLNSGLVLSTLFQARQPVRMATLVDETRLSRRTVELILSSLIDDGWAAETSEQASDRLGRPPRQYEFRRDSALYATIALDPHAVTAAIVDAYGHIRTKASKVLADIQKPGDCLQSSAELLEAVITDSACPRSSIRSIGISVTGRVDDDGTILHLPFAPGWAGVRPGDLFSRTFGLPTQVDNDTNLAALAEQWLGGAGGYSTFVWLIAGYRLGAGIVVRKEILKGLHGAAGEVVQVQSMGLGAMRAQPLGLISSPVPSERERALAIIRAAEEGDSASLRMVEQFLDLVEPVIATFAWTIAPEAIFLGGGLDESELLINELRRRLAAAELPPIQIRPSRLGHDAPLMGAAYMARSSLQDTLAQALRENHLITDK